MEHNIVLVLHIKTMSTNGNCFHKIIKWDKRLLKVE